MTTLKPNFENTLQAIDLMKIRIQEKILPNRSKKDKKAKANDETAAPAAPIAPGTTVKPEVVVEAGTTSGGTQNNDELANRLRERFQQAQNKIQDVYNSTKESEFYHGLQNSKN